MERTERGGGREEVKEREKKREKLKNGKGREKKGRGGVRGEGGVW